MMMVLAVLKEEEEEERKRRPHCFTGAWACFIHMDIRAMIPKRICLMGVRERRWFVFAEWCAEDHLYIDT